jgi:hypothetical protein
MATTLSHTEALKVYSNKNLCKSVKSVSKQ